jgi:hypothetical protein
LKDSSPVASNSIVTFAVPPFVENFKIGSPKGPMSISEKTVSNVLYKSFDLKRHKNFPLDISLSYSYLNDRAWISASSRPNMIILDRHLTGIGQERGGVQVSVLNSFSYPVKALYLEILPWYMRFYLHTMIDINGNSLASKGMCASAFAVVFLIRSCSNFKSRKKDLLFPGKGPH